MKKILIVLLLLIVLTPFTPFPNSFNKVRAADLRECVDLYENSFYRDYIKLLCIGDYNSNDIQELIGKIESFYIPQDLQVIFYSGNNLDGNSKTFTGSVLNLSAEQMDGCNSIKECFRSIKIQGNPSDLSVIKKKLLLITFDPYLPSKNSYLIDYAKANFGWNDPYELNNTLLNWFNNTGKVEYTVSEQLLSREFPRKLDGYIYNENDYYKCLANDPEDCHDPDIVDYAWIENTFNICEKQAAGEIDEVWLQGAPYFGFWESMLMGPNPYHYNGDYLVDSTCTKNVPVMGFNYQRGISEMKHDYTHRFEATMKKFFNGWSWTATPSNDWERFSLVDHLVSTQNISGCGNGHFPPNGVDDYDYTNTSYVDSYCDEFLGFPLENDSMTKTKRINCQEWGCTGDGYFNYWFSHLPHTYGTADSGLKNNWWIYLIDPNKALERPSQNTTPIQVAENLAKGKGVRSANAQSPSSYMTNGVKFNEGISLDISNSHNLDSNRKWLQIDLGGTYNISEINLQGDNDLNVRLEFSYDAYTWKDMGNIYNPVRGTGARSRKLTFNDEPARYVRLLLLDLTKKYYFSEIEIYGQPFTLNNQAPNVNPGINFKGPKNTTITLEANATDPENDALQYKWSYYSSGFGTQIVSPTSGKTEVLVPDNMYDGTEVKFKLEVYDGYHPAIPYYVSYTIKGNHKYDIKRVETSPINPDISKNISELFDGTIDQPNGAFTLGNSDGAIIVEFTDFKNLDGFKVSAGSIWDVYAADSYSDMINNRSVITVLKDFHTTGGGLQIVPFKTTRSKVFKIVSKSQSPVNITEVEPTFVSNLPPIISEIPEINLDEDTKNLPQIDLVNFATDPEGGQITWSISQMPQTITAKITGTIFEIVSLPQNWNGTDTLILKATDSLGDYTTKQINIKVNPINDAPIIQTLPTIILDEDTSNFPVVDLKNYVVDPEGDVIAWKVKDTLTRSNIKFNIDAVGKLTITALTPNYNGVNTYTLTVTDSNGAISLGELKFQINPINDKPIVENISNKEIQAGGVFKYQVKATDIDSTLTYKLIDYPVGMSIDSSGLINWMAPKLSRGYKSVTVEVSDGEYTETRTFSIRVYQIYF